MNILELQMQSLYPTVLFGEYFIPNGVKPNDVYVKCPIEWLVLEIDTKKRKALLLCKHVIDWEGFADCPILGSGYETSWDKSYLRTWLNGEFYKSCFSLHEQKQIVPVHNKTPNGKRIVDKVFLLSTDEVGKYFSKSGSAVALEPMIETASAGDNDDPIEITYEPVVWWTRTSGSTKDMVMCVGVQGDIFEIDSNCDEVGVRPALWVRIW